jgi:integrase
VRGHLEERGKNVWRAKVFLGRDATTGRRHYVNRTIHGTRREAEAVLNELLVEAGGRSPMVADGTFAELAEGWLELNEGQLSPTTRRAYRSLLDRLILPRFGTRKVRTIQARDLDEFYAWLLRSGGEESRPLSAGSVMRVHSLIRRLLNQGVKWGWCGYNAATRATPPRERRHEFQVPSPGQVTRLIDAAAKSRDPEIADFLRLAVVTGARRGELCALRWSDVDLEGARLTISRSIVDGSREMLIEKDTKTHSSRRIYLDTATIDLLRRRHADLTERASLCGIALAGDAFVFSDVPDGTTPWRPSRVTLAFGRLCERLGIEGIRLHDLRHFAATRMLVGGVPVKTVSGRLGHANAATTLNVYAHFLDASDADAAAVLAKLLEPSESPLNPGQSLLSSGTKDASG